MPMRLQADTLRDEVDQVYALLGKWKERLSEGIPGDEMPASDLSIDTFQYQLRGELVLCAERITAVVEALES